MTIGVDLGCKATKQTKKHVAVHLTAVALANFMPLSKCYVRNQESPMGKKCISSSVSNKFITGQWASGVFSVANNRRLKYSAK